MGLHPKGASDSLAAASCINRPRASLCDLGEAVSNRRLGADYCLEVFFYGGFRLFGVYFQGPLFS